MDLLIGILVVAICAPLLYALTMGLAGAAMANRIGLLVAIPFILALLVFAALTA